MDNMEQTEQLDREQLEQQMEQALIRRAVGYDYTETRREWNEKTGEKVTEQSHHMAPDLRALMFWLKNRCPQRWRDKPEGGREEMEGQEMVRIIDDL